MLLVVFMLENGCASHKSEVHSMSHDVKKFVGSMVCSLGVDAIASLAGSQYTFHHLVCDVVHLEPTNMSW